MKIQLTVTNKSYTQTYGRNLFSKVIILDKKIKEKQNENRRYKKHDKISK